jgi:hypothetical protein
MRTLQWARQPLTTLPLHVVIPVEPVSLASHWGAADGAAGAGVAAAAPAAKGSDDDDTVDTTGWTSAPN